MSAVKARNGLFGVSIGLCRPRTTDPAFSAVMMCSAYIFTQSATVGHVSTHIPNRRPQFIVLRIQKKHLSVAHETTSRSSQEEQDLPEAGGSVDNRRRWWLKRKCGPQAPTTISNRHDVISALLRPPTFAMLSQSVPLSAIPLNV